MQAVQEIVQVGESRRHTLAPIHVLLTVQTVVIIFGSINRLTSIFSGYVLPNEFLRWIDLNNMLIIPLVSLVAFYLLKKTLEYDSATREGRAHRVLNVVFIVGVYLLGASYGDHEVTNYLNTRFCDPDASSTICQIIVFNDDEFSHWLFFAGFVLVNATLLLIQMIFPNRGTVTPRDKALLIVNGLFIGAGIFANLGFEPIGLDLYVVALLAVLAVGLLVRRGAQPLFVYYSTAYIVGLVATAVVKIAGVS
jgi:hypothetical protein